MKKKNSIRSSLLVAGNLERKSPNSFRLSSSKKKFCDFFRGLDIYEEFHGPRLASTRRKARDYFFVVLRCVKRPKKFLSLSLSLSVVLHEPHTLLALKEKSAVGNSLVLDRGMVPSSGMVLDPPIPPESWNWITSRGKTRAHAVTAGNALPLASSSSLVARLPPPLLPRYGRTVL